jgi:hypothetical protein
MPDQTTDWSDGWRDCGGSIYCLHHGGADVAMIYPMVKGGWRVRIRLGDRAEDDFDRQSEEAARLAVREALRQFRETHRVKSA